MYAMCLHLSCSIYYYDPLTIHTVVVHMYMYIVPGLFQQTCVHVLYIHIIIPVCLPTCTCKQYVMCTYTHVQIFKPADLVDDRRDFSTVLLTLQELYNIAAGQSCHVIIITV